MGEEEEEEKEESFVQKQSDPIHVKERKRK
jgi:hypothetical protein